MPIARQKADFEGYNLMIGSNILLIKHSFNQKSKHCLLFVRSFRSQDKAMLKSDKSYEERMALATRLREALSKTGMKKAVADACDISEQAITGWLNTGRVATKRFPVIERVTGYSMRYLMTGEGPEFTNVFVGAPEFRLATGVVNASGTSNAEITGQAIYRVPLISWVSAGKFTESIGAENPAAVEEWIETTTPVRINTFALRVTGESMEPEFPDGAIIIVEPDLEPVSGDYVVVRNGDNEAMFKRLVKDGVNWMLVPLNPRYPIRPLSSLDAICGVVRSQQKRYR